MSLHCALYFTPIPLYGPALCANLFGSRYENTPMFEVTTPLWQEVYFQDAYRKRNKILYKNAAALHCILSNSTYVHI